MPAAIHNWISVRYASIIFSMMLIIGYSLVSLIAFVETGNSVYVTVAFLSFVSALTILAFDRIRIISSNYSIRKIVIDAQLVIVPVFTIFFIFVSILIATVGAIPLIAWFFGADSEMLAVMREEFLKAREGWQTIFPYINSVLTGALIPYCLAHIFIERFKWRWPVFLGFFAYCTIFIEKVFFFKAVLPLAYVMLTESGVNKLKIFLLLIISLLLVLALVVVSGFGANGIISDEFYFSKLFRPNGPFEFLLWRIISVPVFTAADSIVYFTEELGSVFLLGASSGFLSVLSGQERIFFEREVFGYQWGQTVTGTGAANAAFFIDAYVNFGWGGVLFVSAIIGLLFKYFRLSRDRALHAVWPLFAFGLYASGFVGTLMSNGFSFVFIFSAFVKLKTRSLSDTGNGCSKGSMNRTGIASVCVE